MEIKLQNLRELVVDREKDAIIFNHNYLITLEDNIKKFIINYLNEVYLPNSNIKFIYSYTNNNNWEVAGKKYSKFINVQIQFYSNNLSDFENKIDELKTLLYNNYFNKNISNDSMLLYDTLHFNKTTLDYYIQNIYLLSDYIQTKSQNNIIKEVIITIEDPSIPAPQNNFPSKSIEGLNISIPINRDFSNGDIISIDVKLNNSNFIIESTKIKDDLATDASSATSTPTKKYYTLQPSNLNLPAGASADKLHPIYLTLKNEDNHNQIVYTLNTQSVNYYIDNSNQCNNKNQLLDRLNCYNTTISAINKANNSNGYGIIHNTYDKNNNIKYMYVYHSSKPDDIPNHAVEECVVGTTNKCGSPGSTSSSESVIQIQKI